MARKKGIRTAVKEGQGPPPGYAWNVWYLTLASVEARRFLDAAQYEHIALQFQELARQADATHSDVMSVRKMSPHHFHELRDKGGILGKLNVRVFFGIDADRRSIVVLGAIKKETDGATPPGTLITMNRRWRKYAEGDYGYPDR